MMSPINRRQFIICGAGVSGCLVARLGGSRVWALAASVLAFLYTGSIVNEPGHPQGLIALAALLIPLVACVSADASSWRCWLSIGVIAGLIFHIKPNAGTFIIAAVLLAVLSQQGPFRHRGILKSALLTGLRAYLLLQYRRAGRHCLVAPSACAEPDLGACCFFRRLNRGDCRGIGLRPVSWNHAMGYRRTPRRICP